MEKIWKGRTGGEIDPAADRLNASIGFDKRLYAEDIEGSVAHVKMLAHCGIISGGEGELLVKSLLELLSDIRSGKTEISEDAEDIHSFVESELTSRIGAVAKKIHTARSRNDQVALDFRLHVRKSSGGIAASLRALIHAIVGKAEENLGVVMPGFTHMQHAQPILFSHWLMSYAEMFLRDAERFDGVCKSCSVSPIGACALAGTDFPTDRKFEADLLGMDAVTRNSLDSVSDRDFALEFLFAAAVFSMHMSRLSEEIVTFSSSEYSFIRISDAYSTGSSIMPQKKNPDIAELVRGKTGRLYGNLISLLVTMKSLPLAYNKDMQEDKEAVFDSIDSVKGILSAYPGMIREMMVNAPAMRESAEKGYLNATDVADYLSKKGMPFRDAYNLTGKIVNEAAARNLKLCELPLEDYRKFSPLFGDDIYTSIDIVNCVNARKSFGGTAIECVREAIADMKRRVGE